MIRFLVSAIILLQLPTIVAIAQQGREVLVPLETMPMQSAHANNTQQSKSTIELPFFDDFSWGKHYANPALWSNAKHVLINTTYAQNSPTVGVATFDAISSNGLLHNTSPTPFSSDTLESQTINLNFPNDTTIYFSFLFQPQGYGNQPDLRDSLLLEFYDNIDNSWVGVWTTWVDFSSNTIYQKDKLRETVKQVEANNLNQQFFTAHFSILGERFLSSDFKFRFRNIASISANTDVPSLRGNCDHWHIDQVYINRFRSFSDTIINDVAFFEPLVSILNNFESVPWSHFNQQAQNQELNNPLGFSIKYRNMGTSTWNVTRRFSVFNHSNDNEYNFSGGAENIYPFDTTLYTRDFLYDFESSWADSARFTFETYLITDVNPETYHLRWNDTLRYTQRFNNYYAYDDGSAESGYGLFGEGTQNGRVAVKFNTYKADWLVGVYMYFNRTANDANQKYFRLAIWNDNNGKPGDIIYEELGLRPEFTDSLNRFSLYKLEEELWLDAGTFYIGWIQTTTDMLNVGFDLNRVNNNKLFYNITGAWQNSQFEGSLMLRPVFGELTEPPTQNQLLDNKKSFTLYPNPANQFVSLDVNTQEPVDIVVYSITGQQVMSVEYRNQPVDISRLPSGSYLVRAFGRSGILGTQKLVVVR